jgi:aminoglycoside phosphotransferase family enzyme/adenylate kinase family enzyme
VAGNQTKQSKLIASLLKPGAFPHPVASPKLLETHISWVILTGTYAYKIKKSIKLDFLDFSTLRQRRHFCEEELRLNRRTAPQLYLDVVPICGSEDKPEVSGEGRVIEYALKMHQFRQSAQLDKQLDAGFLNENDMRDLAATVGAYHQDAARLDFSGDQDAVRQVSAPQLDNFPPINAVTDMKSTRRIQDWTLRSLRDLEQTLIERHKSGYVRECHGDLHLANLVRLPSGIVAFDCVEFSAALRNIDVISDVAFLAMDLVARARQDLAGIFVNRYLEYTGDYSGMSVFGLYFVYHCMIRAKVAAVRSDERRDAAERDQDIAQLKHYLGVAVRWIKQPPPIVVGMHGFSGSGKTWLSTQLMSELPAIRVRSDIERKRRLDLAETASSDSQPGRGAYTAHARADIYESMLAIIDGLIEARYNVIADASFLRRTDRRLLEALAERKGVAMVWIDVSADNDELLRRLQHRTAARDDASEADTAVLDYQYEHADPLTAAETERTVFVETDRQVDPGAIIKSIKSMH